jgi:hypothetical protein
LVNFFFALTIETFDFIKNVNIDASVSIQCCTPAIHGWESLLIFSKESFLQQPEIPLEPLAL